MEKYAENYNRAYFSKSAKKSSAKIFIHSSWNSVKTIKTKILMKEDANAGIFRPVIKLITRLMPSACLPETNGTSPGFEITIWYGPYLKPFFRIFPIFFWKSCWKIGNLELWLQHNGIGNGMQNGNVKRTPQNLQNNQALPIDTVIKNSNFVCFIFKDENAQFGLLRI